MFRPTNYRELCNAMQCGAQVQIDATVGIINGISREDGSGRCWNVKMYYKDEQGDGRTKTIFFRE